MSTNTRSHTELDGELDAEDFYKGTKRMEKAHDAKVALQNELKDKGIFFEHYDLPGLEPRGDLYVGEGGFKTAWFKDPGGNILSLVEGSD